MNHTNYKRLHESFVQNHNGTTIWENFFVITPSPFLIFLVCYLKFFFYRKIRYNALEKTWYFFLEFFMIIFVQVLCCTVLSDYLVYVLCFCCSNIICILFFELNGKKRLIQTLLKSHSIQEKRPHITYFKSILAVITAICILGVDFQIFPRRFAKTETFGYGLMDTGIGLYTMSTGVVVSNKNKKSLINKSFYSSLPILGLGLIRYLTVEMLDYQKHVTEYGVHWNFFFTLALVRVFGSLLVALWPKRTVYVGATIGILHQLILSSGFQEWILDDIKRDDFITANREGIVSLPGYLSLYLISVSIGTMLRSKTTTVGDALNISITLSAGYLILLVCTFFSEDWFGISRRLANATYILWITSMVLLIISLALLVEVMLRIICNIHKIPSKALYLTPRILEAINYNNLFFFLLVNILTGIINMSVYTVYSTSIEGLAIITLYMFVSCCIMQLLYSYNIKLKLW